MGISEAISAAKFIARSFLDEKQEPSADAGETVDLMAADTTSFLSRELEEARSRIQNLERISLEYFDVIERIEKERDQWKDMFFTQSSEHQNAQALLQKLLADSSNYLRSALKQLNFFRSGADLEPVATPQMLESYPKDVPEKYGEKMRELASTARPQTDGLAERQKIAERAKAILDQKSVDGVTLP